MINGNEKDYCSVLTLYELEGLGGLYGGWGSNAFQGAQNS